MFRLWASIFVIDRRSGETDEVRDETALEEVPRMSDQGFSEDRLKLARARRQYLFIFFSAQGQSKGQEIVISFIITHIIRGFPCQDSSNLGNY